MSFILGMDTGGTYTDGVIIEAGSGEIVSKAKALTTKDDLTVGIKKSLEQLDQEALKKVGLVSLSTTLATNATVEGRGGRVALIYMGADLEGDVPASEVIKVKGRFDIMGRLKEDVDREEVRTVLEGLKGRVDALAVSGYAGVRNSKHELEVKDMAEEILGVPVVCAHQLTSALGFQHRTVTAVLNGRLIPIIDSLLVSTRKVLKEEGIECPVMIVKGDGTLMTEKMALSRPVETILSGPAASVMGGLALTGNRDGIVVDMGGTTTDIADVSGGQVRIRKEGANIGGWNTRVQAVDISTFGIGGDSRIFLDRLGRIQVGPERVIPLCVAGYEHPGLLREMKPFYRVGDMKAWHHFEADCYKYMGGEPSEQITEKDERMLAALRKEPHSISHLAKLAGKDPEKIDLTPWVKEGVIARIGFTPTDILHIQGRYDRWNRDMSHEGAKILAKRYEKSPSAFIAEAEELIKNRIAVSIVQAAANFDGADTDLGASQDAMYILDRAFGRASSSVIRPKVGLRKTLVAIGAPAGVWLRDAAKLLDADTIVPEDADVANAYGAAVGQVIETVDMLISLDGRKYILNAPWERFEYSSLEEAMFYAIHEGRKHIEHLMMDAGYDHWNIEEEKSDIVVKIDDNVYNTEEENSRYMGTKVTLIGVGERTEKQS